ncbi:lipase family protein [Streptomyces zingiberis]|uniref:Lipase n=1 Tax=Streptomyces zingiberis TaxID=2053010 RepID=A0ABX1BVX0_9ACTN|nr:lipase family protein [Streptomyces zingiberis]NJP99886.1 lipase [Streptomyces zingiberis]
MTTTTVLEDPPENAPAGVAFYTPPELPSEGERGSPVYQRRLDNPVAQLKEGDNWLVLYRSQDAHGGPVATSGILALPRTPPPAAGFPVISWAHGTVGVSDLCAPSRDDVHSPAHAVNTYPQTLLNTFLRRGWAVAMTDYEHLGTTGGRHPYMLGASHAAAVLDIVRAARRLFPGRLARRFAIVGHSQGGQAALFAAHHSPSHPDLDLAGVAAIAPANHLLGIVRAGSVVPSHAEDGGYAFTPLLLSGALGGDPAIRPEQVLSRAAHALWPHVDERCRAGLSHPDSWGGLRGTEQFRGAYPALPNPDQQRFDAQLAAMNPDLTLPVPARISQAADDPRVRADPAPLQGTDDLVAELRELNATGGRPLLYQRYPAGEVPGDEPLGVHFATINHDLPHLVAWLTPLLNGAGYGDGS